MRDYKSILVAHERKKQRIDLLKASWPVIAAGIVGFILGFAIKTTVDAIAMSVIVNLPK